MNKHASLRPNGHRYMALDDFEEFVLNMPEDEKWELIDGRVMKAVVGARISHNIIAHNVSVALQNHLRATSKPCRAYQESVYLKKRENDLAAFPDVMVRCGPINRDATSFDDPLILFEIVSPSSEERDRTLKRIAYQRLDSLQQFILVARDQPLVDVYLRSETGWRGEPPLTSLDAVLKLPAIDFELPLAEIYRDALPPAGG